jgi:hypothetical protein
VAVREFWTLLESILEVLFEQNFDFWNKFLIETGFLTVEKGPPREVPPQQAGLFFLVLHEEVVCA